MNQQTPLDEFEFRPGAEIRKPDNRREKQSAKGNRTNEFLILMVVLIFVLTGTWVYHFRYVRATDNRLSTLLSEKQQIETRKGLAFR